MADFGLYSALRGTDNWAQRRQSKMNDMLMLTEMENQAKAKQQEAMAAEEGINKYFDEITQLQSEYLPEDAERIKQVEKSARENIIKGISAFNGDLSRYVASGGITDLHTYKNSILQSKEVRNAQLNKVNFGALMKDFQDGNKYIKDVEVKIPLMDENGERKKDEKGNPLLEVKKVSGEEAIKLFRDKKIDYLPYNGSEEVIKLNPLTFSQYFKDPKNPASKDNVVTGATIHSWAINNGKSEEYANKLVKSYYNMLDKGGETWKFKALSDEEIAAMEAKKTKSSSSGSEGTIVLNQLAPALQRLGKAGEPKTMFMGNEDRLFFENNLGLKYDSATKQYKPTMPLVGVNPKKDKNGKDFQFDLTNALSVNFTGRYEGDGNNQYIEATVYYDADEPGENNPHTENLMGGNNYVDDELRHNWKFEGNIVKGTVLIPITERVNDRRLMNDAEKVRGITNKFEAAAASANDQDYSDYILKVAQERGVTPQQLIEEASKYQ